LSFYDGARGRALIVADD